MRCLRPGGYLLLDHSNFRLSDTIYAETLDVVWRWPRLDVQLRSTPLYGRDNHLLAVQRGRGRLPECTTTREGSQSAVRHRHEISPNA